MYKKKSSRRLLRHICLFLSAVFVFSIFYPFHATIQGDEAGITDVLDWQDEETIIWLDEDSAHLDNQQNESSVLVDLLQLITEARQLDEYLYTTESWMNFQDALEYATVLFYTDTSSLDELENALNRLIYAIEILQLEVLPPNQYFSYFNNSTQNLPTQQNAVIIRTPEELASISTGIGSIGTVYMLANNINLTNEWEPISDFRGFFDGQGFAINNLFILGTSDHDRAGLFANTGGATIKNVTVNIGDQGINIYKASWGLFAGGLVGNASNTTIINSHVIGDVTINNYQQRAGSSGYTAVGGLVGRFSSGNNIIDNSSVKGNISLLGAGSGIGGLVGLNWTNGTVTVSNSFATGNILSARVSQGGPAPAGGIFGIASMPTSAINTYAANSIFVRDFTELPPSRSAGAGDIAGNTTNFTITNTFRASNKEIISDGNIELNITHSGIPLTSVEMQLESSFTGWDFINVWEFRSGENNGFPVLRGSTNISPTTNNLHLANYYRYTLNRYEDRPDVPVHNQHYQGNVIQRLDNHTRIFLNYYIVNTHGNRWYKALSLPSIGQGEFWIYSGNLTTESPGQDMEDILYINIPATLRINPDRDMATQAQIFTPVLETITGTIGNISNEPLDSVTVTVTLPEEADFRGNTAYVTLRLSNSLAGLTDAGDFFEEEVPFEVSRNSNGLLYIDLSFNIAPGQYVRWWIDIRVTAPRSATDYVSSISYTIDTDIAIPENRRIRIHLQQVTTGPGTPFTRISPRNYQFNGQALSSGTITVPGNLLVSYGETLRIPPSTTLIVEGNITIANGSRGNRGALNMVANSSLTVYGNFNFDSSGSQNSITGGAIRVHGNVNITTGDFAAGGTSVFEVINAPRANSNQINVSSSRTQFNRLVLPDYRNVVVNDTFRVNTLEMGRPTTPVAQLPSASQLNINTGYRVNWLGASIPSRNEEQRIRNRIDKAFAITSVNNRTEDFFQGTFSSHGITLNMTRMGRNGTGQVELTDIYSGRIIRYRVTFSNMFSFNGVSALGQGTYQQTYPTQGQMVRFTINNTTPTNIRNAQLQFEEQMDRIARRQFENVEREFANLYSNMLRSSLYQLVPRSSVTGQLVSFTNEAEKVLKLVKETTTFIENYAAVRHIVRQDTKCPVDIFVYYQGQRVGSIVEGETTFYSSNANILLSTEGDVKVVVIFGQNNYDIITVARDAGTMDIRLTYFDDAGAELSRAIFRGIALAAGDSFTTEFADTIITRNGTYVFYTPDHLFLDENIQNINISISQSSGGEVMGYGTHFLGDPVNLFAIATEEHVFNGWYENNSLVSGSAHLSFIALESRNFEARFSAEATSPPSNGGTPPPNETQPTPSPSPENESNPPQPLPPLLPLTPQPTPPSQPENEYPLDNEYQWEQPPNDEQLEIEADNTLSRVNIPTPPLLLPGSRAVFTVDLLEYTLNGQLQVSAGAPFIDRKTNRMMVPLRTLAEATGAQVSWEGDTRSVMIHTPEGVMILPVDQPLPNGMGQPALIYDRVFIPLRFVMDTFDADVQWDGANRAAVITWQ